MQYPEAVKSSYCIMDSLKLVLQFVVANTIWALALRALARTTQRFATSSGKHTHVEWLSQHVFCRVDHVTQ